MVLIKEISLKRRILEERKRISLNIETFIVNHIDNLINNAKSNDYSLLNSLEDQLYRENANTNLPLDLVADLDSFVQGKISNQKGQILYNYAREPSYKFIKKNKKLLKI
jgi:hypothetical protein